MIQKDMHNNIVPKRCISPVSVADNTAQVGQIIDNAGYGALEYLIALGSIADADMTVTILLEHGDASNLSDAAAVPDELLIGTEAGAAFQFDSDNATRKLGYIGGKRYTRLTITPSGNASAALICAIALLGHPQKAPLTSQSA